MTDNKHHTFPDPASFIKILSEFSIRLRKIGNQTDLCTLLHKHVFPLIGYHFSEIYLYNRSDGIFLPPSQTIHHSLTKRSGTIPTSIVRQDLTIDLEADFPTSIIYNQNTKKTPESLTITGNHSHLIVPVVDKNDINALLYCGRPQEAFFNEDHAGSMLSLAAIIGSKLENIATIEKLQASVSTLEHTEKLRSALHEISEQTHVSDNLEGLYRSFHHTVNRLMPARNLIIAVAEKKEPYPIVHFPYFVDRFDQHANESPLILDEKGKKSLTAFVLKSGKPLLITPDNYRQICEENDIVAMGTKPFSWLGVPFYLPHLSGVVIVQSYDEIIYTEKDKSLLLYVARHVGCALQYKKNLDELQAVKKQIQQDEQKKCALLANISHEIRTPMNGVIGITELLLETDINEQQQGYLEMIRTSSNRLLTLINDILDFSKIKAGKLELRMVPFNFRTTLSDTLAMQKIAAKRKGLNLIQDIPKEIPETLIGDENRFYQIILNLVNNAIKFTDEGEVHLQVKLAEDQPKEDDNQSIILHFSLSDTGIGISRDQQNKIFDAFSQAQIIKERNDGGTGLGLAITAQLVELMDGRIWVDSRPGHGSCFHFTARFWLQDTKRTEPPSQKKGPPADRKNTNEFHILVVEDEPISQTLTVTILEHEGWQVTAVSSGREAVDHVNRYSYDLVLMDIQMPKMDGNEATRLIRKKDKNLPIIVMTAFTEKEDREKYLSAGINSYISKPIDSVLLRNKINRILATAS
ncbi:MAG: hypothetical protein CSA26_07770 [Desulfobacterales bacterium]|nr:MAG: hypothetical protein CSA26_07770 [Desulfobacterales bacterium]